MNASYKLVVVRSTCGVEGMVGMKIAVSHWPKSAKLAQQSSVMWQYDIICT